MRIRLFAVITLLCIFSLLRAVHPAQGRVYQEETIPPPLYLPLLSRPSLPTLLQGRVEQRGIPVVGLTVKLYRSNDGANVSLYASATTDLLGTYLFQNLESLTGGQYYYVAFANTGQVVPWLDTWQTPEIKQMQEGDSLSLESFDIDGVELVRPIRNAIIDPPFVFEWRQRPHTPSDLYKIEIFGKTDEGSEFSYLSGPIPYSIQSVSFQCFPPPNPGLVAGGRYHWRVIVESPTSGNGVSQQGDVIFHSIPLCSRS